MIQHPNENLTEKQALIELVRAPATWVLTIIGGVWAYSLVGFTEPLALLTLFAFILAGLTVIDMRHMILPDTLNVAGLLLALLAFPLWFGSTWWFGVLGAAVGFGLFAALHYGYYFLRGKHGLGFGDVKLLGMLGAWVGAYDLILVLLLSSLTALVGMTLYNMLGKRGYGEPLPFGPFLCLGGWVVLLYGGWIWQQLDQLSLLLV